MSEELIAGKAWQLDVTAGGWETVRVGAPYQWTEYHLNGECAIGDELALVNNTTVRRSRACAARYAEQEREGTTTFSLAIEGVSHERVTPAPERCRYCDAGPAEYHEEWCRTVTRVTPPETLDGGHRAPTIPAAAIAPDHGYIATHERAAAKRREHETRPDGARDRVARALTAGAFSGAPATLTNAAGWYTPTAEQLFADLARMAKEIAEIQKRDEYRVRRDRDAWQTKLAARGIETRRESAVAALTHVRIAPPHACESCGYVMLRSERWKCGACGHVHATVRA